jgi:cyclopropane-fatty-acyl-phospholipid synthase
MPSDDLLFNFMREMQVEAHWRLDGREYQRTAQAWLENLDANRVEVERVLAGSLGRSQARLDAERWRLFFLACAELFGYRNGEEWLVSHYVLSPSSRGVAR